MVMTVTIVGKNIQLTQALKNIIYEKVEKLEKKHFHGRTNYSIKVILKVENKNHIAEVLVYKNKRVLKKSFSSHDMYKSINETFETLDRAIRKHKEKLRSKKLQGMQEVKNYEMNLDDEIDDLFEDNEDTCLEV
jgi:putative sigma-54 modulation protein